MPATAKVWTILEVLKWSENFLKEKGLADARSDAEQLLMAAMQLDRLAIYTRFDQALSETERSKYREYILRRSRQEPVQYITGFTYFMGLKLQVNKDVLIPRTDTEVLVESVVNNLKVKDEPLTIIDIGTGSGAIAISIAKFSKAAKVIALDVSEAALELAKKNAEANKVEDRIEFLKSNLLEELIHRHIEDNVVIVANPPYITSQDFKTLPSEIKNYEPKNALWGGTDGLRFYRAIIDQAVIFHNLKGVFFEVGYNQSSQLKTMLETKFRSAAEVQRDLGGIPRVVYTLLS